MGTILQVTPGGWKALAKLPAPNKLPAGQTIACTMTGLALSVALGEPVPGGEISIGIARWDDVTSQWFPSQQFLSPLLGLFPSQNRPQMIVLSDQDPSSVTGTKEEVLATPVPGTYVAVWLPTTDPPVNLQVVATPVPLQAGLGGGGFGIGGGSANYQEWMTAPPGNGANAAASLNSLVNAWNSAGDALYTLPIVAQARAGNLQYTFDATFDAPGIIVTGSRFGVPVKEQVLTQNGKTVPGNEVFDIGSITRIEKISSGTTGTVSIGIGNKAGLNAIPSGNALLLYVDDALTPMANVTVDQARSAITLATAIAFDGKRQYRALY